MVGMVGIQYECGVVCVLHSRHYECFVSKKVVFCGCEAKRRAGILCERMIIKRTDDLQRGSSEQIKKYGGRKTK